MSLAEQGRQFAMVERAIVFIRSRARSQPSLAEIAEAVGVSEFHLQRTFSAWAGLSPKRFLQYLTKERAKSALRESADILSAAHASGLSGPGRLHDLMVSCEAMTPGEYKRQGAGVEVGFGIGDTPFGEALIGWTARGVCHLVFCEQDRADRLQQFMTAWSAATLTRDDQAAAAVCMRIFDSAPETGQLHLLLRGTNFQIKVWEALLKIGSSRLVSYSTLAGIAGVPQAQRAVGSAIAANQIGFLIPCHRVIRGSGEVGRYRWGGSRKLAMQVWEAGRAGAED